MAKFARSAAAIRRNETAHGDHAAPTTENALRPYILAVIALVLLACGGETTEPAASFSGMYELLAVNGDQPPALLWNSPCAALVASAWIVVDANSLTSHTSAKSNACEIGTQLPETDRLGYVRVGTQLRITFPALIFGLTWVDSGTIAGDMVTIRHHLAMSDRVSVWRIERLSS